MTRPSDVTVCDRYGRTRSFTWTRLDPALADYESEWGLVGPAGLQFLITGAGRLVAVGLWSGLWPASLPTLEMEIWQALSYGTRNLGRDRKIPADTWRAWSLEQ